VSTPILLVDDDPSIRRSLGRLLRAHDYEVLEAENVARALEILATARPALMLVDMVMPGESSLDAVRKIKLEPRTATLPISPQDRALFAEIVAKPSDASALLDTIARILRPGE
jgi:two-component system OmpR family response regulator